MQGRIAKQPSVWNDVPWRSCHFRSTSFLSVQASHIIISCSLPGFQSIGANRLWSISIPNMLRSPHSHVNDARTLSQLNTTPCWSHVSSIRRSYASFCPYGPWCIQFRFWVLRRWARDRSWPAHCSCLWFSPRTSPVWNRRWICYRLAGRSRSSAAISGTCSGSKRVCAGFPRAQTDTKGRTIYKVKIIHNIDPYPKENMFELYHVKVLKWNFLAQIRFHE